MTKNITTNLFQDIRQLIESAKQRVSMEFNITHVQLNWHIGQRINQEILNNERAEYGKELIENLSTQLKCNTARDMIKQRFLE